MNYRIEAQSKRRIRIRLKRTRITDEEARILEYAFSGMQGVTKVTVYRATGGCAKTGASKKGGTDGYAALL